MLCILNFVLKLLTKTMASINPTVFFVGVQWLELAIFVQPYPDLFRIFYRMVYHIMKISIVTKSPRVSTFPGETVHMSITIIKPGPCFRNAKALAVYLLCNHYLSIYPKSTSG